MKNKLYLSKLLGLVFALTLITVCSVTLSSCGQKEAKEYANVECEKLGFSKKTDHNIGICDPIQRYSGLGIVVGDHQGSPIPNEDEYSKTVRNAIYSNIREIYIVKASDPQHPKTIIVDVEDREKESFPTVELKVEKIIEKVKQEIEMPPAESHADYIEGIIEVNKKLSTRNAPNKSHEILVLGSGLADQGMLDFAHRGLLEFDLNSIVEEIKKVPKDLEIFEHKPLSRVVIKWMGLGNIILPQASFSESQFKDKEKEIYVKVFKEMGAKAIDIDNSGKSVTELRSFPTDKAMDFVKLKSIVRDPLIQKYDTNNSNLSFKPNGAEFVDQNAAESDIKKFINQMLDDGRNKLTIIAREASLCRGTRQGEISMHRAQKIQAIVKKVNFEIDSIINSQGINYSSIGEGDNPKSNCTPGFNEDLAKNNRLVILVAE